KGKKRGIEAPSPGERAAGRHPEGGRGAGPGVGGVVRDASGTRGSRLPEDRLDRGPVMGPARLPLLGVRQVLLVEGDDGLLALRRDPELDRGRTRIAVRPPGDAQPAAGDGHPDLARGAIRRVVCFADLESEGRRVAEPGANALRAGQAPPDLARRERDGPGHADLEAHLRGLPLYPQPLRPLVADGDHLLPPSALDAALFPEEHHDLFVGHGGCATLVEPADPLVPGPSGGALDCVIRDPGRTGPGTVCRIRLSHHSISGWITGT